MSIFNSNTCNISATNTIKIDKIDNTDNTVIPDSLTWLHLKRNVSGDNLTMLENSGMSSSTTSGATSAILEIENRFKLIIEPSTSTLNNLRNLNTPIIGPNCLSTDQNNSTSE